MATPDKNCAAIAQFTIEKIEALGKDGVIVIWQEDDDTTSLQGSATVEDVFFGVKALFSKLPIKARAALLVLLTHELEGECK